MTRLPLRILLMLFFGAVTTSGVAWVLACVVRADYPETERGMIEYGDVAWHVILSESIGRRRVQSQPIWSDSRAYEIRQTTVVEQWMKVLGPERIVRDRMPYWSRARSGYEKTEYVRMYLSVLICQMLFLLFERLQQNIFWSDQKGNGSA